MTARLPVARVVQVLPDGYLRVRCPHPGTRHIHLLRARPGDVRDGPLCGPYRIEQRR